MQTLLHWPLFVTWVLRPMIWLLLLSVIFIPVERLFAVRKQKIFRRGMLVDLGYYFINNPLIPALVLSVPLTLAVAVGHRVLPASYYAAISGMPLWLHLFVSLLIAEIGFYWGHRWSHEFPLLWRFHAVHHSAEHMDFLVNTRAHIVDLLFTRFCGLMPLSLFGLAVPFDRSGNEVLLIIGLVGTIWEFFIHANVRWRFGPLEWIVSTPAFHHWHHNFADPINMNYAAMFAWLDKVFGTYHAPKGAWPKTYGIPDPMPNSIPEQLVAPLLPRRPVPNPASGPA
jgi:sterol desaturase/sphingolipid hydroxylase (fatty acid hydroxylase superfamily)